jgi:hypothetical protein
MPTDITGRTILSMREIRTVPPGLRIHRDLLNCLSGQTNQFGIMHVGDSLSGTSWETCGTQVQRNIADWMPTAPVFACSATNIVGAPLPLTLAASTIYPISGKYTGTYYEKARFDLAFDGTAMELAAGQYAIFAYGGQTLRGDYLLIPIITGPTGGIVRVRYATVQTPVAGSTWNDPTAGQIVSGHTLTGGQLLVDTYSATPGLTMVRLNIGTLNWLSVRLDHDSGGNVLALKCQTAVKTGSSIPTYRLATASNDFINADMACVPIMARLIAELDYSIIWVASDDTVDSNAVPNPSVAPPYAAYAAFLPVLEAAINASGLTYPPQVVLEGNPYLSNGVYRTDTEMGARIDYCWDWCESRAGWDVLDMMAMSGGLAPTVASGLNGDANPWIHYTGLLARIAADAWWSSRGFNAPQGRRPGGDATTGQLLVGGTVNLINVEVMADMMAAPSAFDTGYMTWAGAATSGGSKTDHSGKTGMRLATSAAVGGAVRAYIDAPNSPMGKDQGNIRGDVRRLGFSARVLTTGANCDFYALMRSGGTYNAAAAGALTASGYGFRVRNNVIVGTCWGALTGSGATGALILSTDTGVAQNGGSVTMVTGSSADYVDCVIRLFPNEVSVVRGRIQWWVNGVMIGEAAYDHGLTYFFGYELLSLNGATTNFTADVSFPKIVRGGGPAA